MKNHAVLLTEAYQNNEELAPIFKGFQVELEDLVASVIVSAAAIDDTFSTPQVIPGLNAN